MTSVLSSARRRWPVAVLILLMAGFAAAGLREAWLDAPTVDEPVYVAAGVLGAVHHDVSFNDEHAPLPKVLAALPVLAAAPRIPGGWSLVQPDTELRYAASFSTAQLAAGKLRAVTFASRLVPIAEALVAGVILYRLASLIFCPAAGAAAAVLWLANPVTIGLGHIDGVDLPLALASGLTSLALLRWIRRRDGWSLVLVGAAAGLAVVMGVAGVVVLAAAVLVVAVTAGTAREWPERVWVALAGSAAAVVLALIVLWASYVVFDPGVMAHPAFGLPAPYVDGLRFLRARHSRPQVTYLFGRELTRRWWYWPAILLVKMPLPALAVLVAGPFALLAVPRQTRREVGLAVALPAVALAAFILFVAPETGIRYFLPAIALLIVVASGVVVFARRYAGWWGTLRSTAVAVLLAAALATDTAMAANSVPHSLAWTTPPFTPGYQFASGSNVDWGQDFYLLREWTRGRDPFVDFHAGLGLGPVALQDARRLPRDSTSRITGWVAVSSTLITGRGNAPPSWLRGYCPVGTLGGSVLIYHFRHPPSSSAPVPAKPAGLCSASGYSHRVPG